MNLNLTLSFHFRASQREKNWSSIWEGISHKKVQRVLQQTLQAAWLPSSKMAYPKNQSLSTYQTPCLDQCKKKENLTQRHLHQTADHPQLHLLTHPDPLLQHCHQAPHSQTQAVHHHSLCLLDFMDLHLAWSDIPQWVFQDLEESLCHSAAIIHSSYLQVYLISCLTTCLSLECQIPFKGSLGMLHQ